MKSPFIQEMLQLGGMIDNMAYKNYHVWIR